ncbi:MAG TPA: PhoX family phosphatase [Methylomirabilota bacterium]|nr:PhoX family phosphatase [Methylomirabilota bacterium]
MHNDLEDVGVNPSANPTFQSVVATRLSRRRLLQGGLAAAALSVSGRRQADAAPLLGFKGVPVSAADTVVVPPGYTTEVLYAWGDPISDGPAFKPDASNTVADQEQQAGMHHDGLHFFPLPVGSDRSARGLLAVNHEYTDDGLLHVGGMQPWTAEKVAKSQAAHGVSVVEVALVNERWTVVRPSPYARRVTGRTPIGFDGPAVGHPRLRTAADPQGRSALGTLNNCAHGVTPWGTYLTCEENFNGYFVNGSDAIPPAQRRYGITKTGFRYRWHEHDPRFDAAAHPNEPNRFGWVVEIDPYDPARAPVKHTALGRFKHEGAALTLARDNRVVAYMGDDERFEYIYKFVSRRPFVPGDRKANRRLLEEGTLHVARFDASGAGEWIALTHGARGLEAAAGFATQADILIDTRAAADVVRATRMDRPEWIAVHPRTGEVYCTLTNNTQRGAAGAVGPDAANPRPANALGHIIRWRERGGDAAATAFEWDIFVRCGDPEHTEPIKRGTIKGDIFGSPDGLWIDARGVLWIQTDVSTSALHRGDYARFGNNVMLAADPATGAIRRFLTGPSGAEITGVVTTPDGRSMFVNVQHPGETASERSDPANPTAVSAWPDGVEDGRPRSATIVIRRRDGGVIGA